MALERLICADCGHRLWHDVDAPIPCPDCDGELRRMGPFEAFVDRWFAPPDMNASDMHRRHLQLVELLWTADERGREWYEIVRPKRVSYSAFVKRVNPLICRGLEEGWITTKIPPAPVPNDSAYSLEITDPERFVDEMGRLFQS
ncbi:MAG: hypothetical protein IT305_24785 [Chloroflexi bacterium]|nr:hypothetical protein [Chloroflexota bacterium]